MAEVPNIKGTGLFAGLFDGRNEKLYESFSGETDPKKRYALLKAYLDVNQLVHQKLWDLYRSKRTEEAWIKKQELLFLVLDASIDLEGDDVDIDF